MKKVLIILVIVFCFYPFQVMATENKDKINKDGEIHITIKKPDTKEPISDVNLKLYCIGTLDESSSSIAYNFTPDFKQSGISINDVNESNKEHIAKVLKNYVDTNKISAIDMYTNKNGVATVKSCDLGLYLVSLDNINEKLSSDSIAPFIIAVPYTSVDGESLIYKVQVSPKIEISIENPTNPSDPNGDGEEDKDKEEHPDKKPEDEKNPNKDPNKDSNGDKLPQTGVLQWPIPVMAIIGVILFSLGWADTFLRRKRNE